MRETGSSGETSRDGSEIGTGTETGIETGTETGGWDKSTAHESSHTPVGGGTFGAGHETGREGGWTGELQGSSREGLKGSAIETGSRELEGPESKELAEARELEEAQKQIEQVHKDTLAAVLEKEGAYISPADQKRIEAGVTSIQAVEDMGPGKTGVYRFDGTKSTIEVRSVNEAQRERTAIHETLHFASHNREVIVPMPEKNGYMVYHTVGTRQSSWFHSFENGNSNFTERGRGLNEGITTVLTNERLQELSPEKAMEAQRQQVYSHAADLVTELKGIVGDDPVKAAFFGGKNQELADKVNQLGGEKAFEQLSSCLDRAISADYGERVAATREAQEILARMSEQAEKQKERS